MHERGKVRVHIVGASGYAAAETIRLLAGHPHVELGSLESETHAGEDAGALFPALRGVSRSFEPPGSVRSTAREGDVVLLCTKSGVARRIAPELLARSICVLDFSDDYRGGEAGAVYGFAERYRDRIACSTLIANPGCYPSAALLATLPMAEFSPRHIIVDAKSGITGAGRTPEVSKLFAEVDGNVRTYGLDGHRHEHEILAQWRAAGIDASLIFTPHVVPMSRGLLVDAYGIFDSTVNAAAIQRAFAHAYATNPFVRILDRGQSPSIPAVLGTNNAEIAIRCLGTTVHVVCAIDNLGRGAAAQAVRNLNIMLGFPEEMGLARSSAPIVA